MSVEYAELFAALAQPFGPDQVRHRSAGGGRQLAYITARHVMIRLDEVCGPSNWWDEYTLLGEDSVLCRLSIRLPDGRVLTKQDAGGYAGMADAGDDDKSAVSDALKRAAVKFGIGRELYGDGVAHLFDGEVREAQQQHPHHPPTSPAPQQQQRGSNGQHGPPRNGKQLFAWVKSQEEKHGAGLLKWLNGYGKLQDWPGRMVDWSSEQVEIAHAEAVRKIDMHMEQVAADDPALAS